MPAEQKQPPGTRARHIAALASEGLTSREIAARVGISHGRICRIARRHGIRLSRPGARQFGLYIPNDRAQMIRQLAEQARVSPATIIERITRVVLEDGIEHARRRLGKLLEE
jgi:IS30 family transposase